MSKRKIYKVKVNITISGFIQVSADNKSNAKDIIDKFLAKNIFCDIHHLIKNKVQFNQVPISYIEIQDKKFYA